MATKGGDKIWHNGELIPWDDAKIHVLSHVIHYGSSLFEGIRCYKTQRGTEVFRLESHVDRLLNSCKIYRTEVPFSKDELMEECLETVRVNSMEKCYIRPIIFRGYGEFGVNPFGCPVEVYIAVWEWGRYLGADAVEKGVDVCVSSWTRIAPNTFPAMAKAGANYMNSQLMKMEALKNGFAEGIALDVNGFVSEGSGENLFVVYRGAIYTPPLSSSILPGITRDSIIRLASELGYTVEERSYKWKCWHAMRYSCLEPSGSDLIRSVDKIGKERVPLPTESRKNNAHTEGRREDNYGWFVPVYTSPRQRRRRPFAPAPTAPAGLGRSAPPIELEGTCRAAP
jgi:branched-chain amino acid aminotransferase